MYIKRNVLLVVLALCYSQVSAEITLKKNFFTGWKYSTDGVRFTKVGFSGNDLYHEMEGNEEAQSCMKKYKSAKTWATVAGIPGGFLIGWPIGGYIGSGGEWKDGYTTMIVVGTPLLVVSTIFEGVATRNLKNSVELYNKNDQALGFMLNVQPPETGESPTLLFGFRYEF